MSSAGHVNVRRLFYAGEIQSEVTLADLFHSVWGICWESDGKRSLFFKLISNEIFLFSIFARYFHNKNYVMNIYSRLEHPEDSREFVATRQYIWSPFAVLPTMPIPWKPSPAQTSGLPQRILTPSIDSIDHPKGNFPQRIPTVWCRLTKRSDEF